MIIKGIRLIKNMFNISCALEIIVIRFALNIVKRCFFFAQNNEKLVIYGLRIGLSAKNSLIQNIL